MDYRTERKPYDTDLSDAEWAIIEPLIPGGKPGGRPRETNIREVINAIFYLLRTGCAWRHLPHDFPPSGTVYDYFSSWTRDGTLKHIHDTLRPGKTDESAMRTLPPFVWIGSWAISRWL